MRLRNASNPAHLILESQRAWSASSGFLTALRKNQMMIAHSPNVAFKSASIISLVRMLRFPTSPTPTDETLNLSLRSRTQRVPRRKLNVHGMERSTKSNFAFTSNGQGQEGSAG